MIEDEEIKRKDEEKNEDGELKNNEDKKESITNENIEERKEEIEKKLDINTKIISEEEILDDKNKDKSENKTNDVIEEDKTVKEEKNNTQEKDNVNIDDIADNNIEGKLPEKEEDKEKEKSEEVEVKKDNEIENVNNEKSNDKIANHVENKSEEEKEKEENKIEENNDNNKEKNEENKIENIEKIKENDMENKNDETKENKMDEANENKIEEMENNSTENKIEEINENQTENKTEEITENKTEEIHENKTEEKNEELPENKIENKIEENAVDKMEEIKENIIGINPEEIKENNKSENDMAEKLGNKIEEIKENKIENIHEEIKENNIIEKEENKIEEIKESKIENKPEEIKENIIENSIKENEPNKLENKIEEIKEKKLEDKKEEKKENIIKNKFEIKEENKLGNSLELKKENKSEKKIEINKENKNENKIEEIDCSEEFKKNNTFTFSKNLTKNTISSKIDEVNPKNIKEINKLKEVLLHSFEVEPISEKKEKKEDKVVDNFILLDKGEEDEDLLFINPTNKKKKIFNEIYKYKNELNLKKKLKKFHLFYNDIKNPGDDNAIYKVGKVLLFTYRKNFPKITNYKTKKTYTTDAWWGCMVRCGQMILSRGIYRLLKATGMDTKSAIMYTIPLFSHYPITKLHIYFQGMITKYKALKNLDDKKEKIKNFFPPFSIKTLCDVGELFERTAGEWFSDVIITQVFKKISEYFALFDHPLMNAKIMTFQSCIQIPDILNSCFIEKKKEKDNLQYIHSKNKYYYFDKMGIVFVNVRVGLDKIPKEYYKGIKGLFELKECIGIVGGKTRLAYYFIGYDNDSDSLLYLDPHVTKEADKEVTLNNVLGKHINKEVHLLKMTKMSTAFTIGFCFRNYDEFLDLFGFWQKAKQDKLPILGIVKQPIVIDFKDNDEDFSPTYDDKEEDDF